MDDLLRRVRIIYDECAPEEKKAGAKLDEFTKIKKDISKQVRDVRALLQERDEKLERGGDNQRTAEISQIVRANLKHIREQIDTLSSIQKKEARKAKKLPGEVREAVNTRAEIVELCYKHVEECEKWEKRLTNEKRNEERSALMAGATPGYEMKTFMPSQETELQDIEDYTDQLQDLKNRNADIDKELEEIGKGVATLKEIAVTMGDELTVQNQMIDQIQTKVETAGAKLETLNARLQQTLDKVMKGDRFLITFVLVCILLAVVGFLATMFV